MMPPDQVPFGMIIVTLFKLIHNIETGYFTIFSYEHVCCPLCGGVLSYRDSKRRYSKDLFGDIRRFLLRRLLCLNCGKLNTEIPDIIQPYKHYDSRAIQTVLDDGKEAAACVADDSTMRRWKSSFTEELPDINGRLASVYAKMTDAIVPMGKASHILDDVRGSHKRWLAFVTALLINSGHKLCTRFAFCPPEVNDKVNIMSKQKGKGGEKFDETIKDSS